MRPYKTQVASDLRRDGLGIELLNDDGVVIAEVFRYDQTNSMVFSAFRSDLPFAVIESFIARAKKELEVPQFEDGIALPPRLVSEELRPVIAPLTEFMPGEDAAEWAAATEQPIAFEVFRRGTGTFGLRCSAWVGWRDAGNVVRSHAWHVLSTGPAVIVDTTEAAKTYAASFADGHGIVLSEWRSTT
jgi:hypothetical protein